MHLAIREVGCRHSLNRASRWGSAGLEFVFPSHIIPLVLAVLLSDAIAAAGYGGIGPVPLFCLHRLTGKFGEPDNNLKGDI